MRMVQAPLSCLYGSLLKKLGAVCNDELLEGLVEQTRIAKGLEPALQFAALDEYPQRLDGTVPVKHWTGIRSCSGDQALIYPQ